MCGIAGFASPDPYAEAPTALAEGIRHRGPDGEGMRQARLDLGSWALFHSRLAIVDLSEAGSQPMADERDEWVMSYNGELYNYRELRRECEGRGHQFSSSMDGEAILHLWEEQGERALGQLNGIFAIAMANTRTGEVVLARDPMGVKPLFYAAGGDGALWFASEIQALTRAGAPSGSHDLVGLAQFLSFMWIPAPRTPFNGIRSLKPGEALRWRPGHNVSTFVYADWLQASAERREMPLQDAVADAGEHLREATQRQLLGDVPIGLMASGGVDSSLIWWAGNGGIHKGYTIAWQRDLYGERLDEDADAVRKVQKGLGTDIDFIPGEDAETLDVPASGDLFADPAYDLARLIARTARKESLKVLLSGQGADELLAGYRRHVMTPITRRLYLGPVGAMGARLLSQIPVRWLALEYLARTARASRRRDPFDRYMELCTYSTPRDRAEILECDETEITNEVVWQQHRETYDSQPSGSSFIKKTLAVDLNVYLPGLGLSYIDRAGMEFGVEVRVPWLDLELVKWALRLPEHALTKGREGKRVGKHLGGQAIGNDLAYRSKRGFAAPMGSVVGSDRKRSDTGFRQAAYLTRATGILDEFILRTSSKPPRTR